MKTYAKACLALGAIAFLIAIISGLMNTAILGAPAESFARAANILILFSIALTLLGSESGSAGGA